MVFAHGFGCNQNMWRFITPAFEQDYRIVLFDYVHDHLRDSELVLMRASGHCPNLSAPDETIAAMKAFLR